MTAFCRRAFISISAAAIDWRRQSDVVVVVVTEKSELCRVDGPLGPPHKLCLRNVVQDLRRINGGTTFEKYFCATCQGEPIVMMCSAGRSVSGLVATCTGVYLCDCEEADKRLCKVE